MRILPISLMGAARVSAVSVDRVGSIGWGKANDMAEFIGQVPGSGREPELKERRTAPRFSRTEGLHVQDAGLLDSPVARLINISRGGLHLETKESMMPGGIVYIRLVAADAVFLLRGTVLRSRPSLMRSLNPIYEIIISFDGNFPMPVEAGTGPRAAKAIVVPPRRHESNVWKSGGQATAVGAQPPTTYTVTASVPRSGPDLNQIFGLNNW